jgi:hypothetical protein
MTEYANTIETDYIYTVTATAEGEVIAKTNGNMEIAKICLAELNASFEPSYSFDLPESGQESVSFPASSTDYVS